MTEGEKPLHVRVALALGWRDCRPCGDTTSVTASGWAGWAPGAVALLDDPKRGRTKIPRYDLDWSETGPLIEKYELLVAPTRWENRAEAWLAAWDFRGYHGEFYVDSPWELVEYGSTALIAVCYLILELAKTGRLGKE